jgi:ABC-type lipoprotein release transport system permease subunit
VTAVWLRARSELRSRWAAILSLALIVGVIGGVVIAAAAGARRTDSAYSRFLVDTGSPNAAVFAGRTEALGPEIISTIRALPQVADSVVIRLPQVDATTTVGKHLWETGVNAFASPFEHPGSRWIRPKVIAGRLPDPSRSDEIAILYNPDEDPVARLGSRIVLTMRKAGADPSNEAPDAFLTTPPLEVTGVVLFVTGLASQGGEGFVFVTPAFERTYYGQAATHRTLAVRLHGGPADVPRFAAAVQRATPRAVVADFGAEAERVQRQTDPQTAALWLFAALAAVAGLLIFGQALARQVFLGSTEHPSLRALGMTTQQLVGIAALRAATIGVLGSVIAAGVAIALSSLAPLGLARLVEPHPGLRIDLFAVVVGSILLAILTIVVVLPAAWRAARLPGDALGIAAISPTRRSPVATRLARGLRPPAATGLRMALEPGRGRSATPVRGTMAAVTFALAGLVFAFGFGASLRTLLHTPRLYGVDWSLTLHAWGRTDAANRWAPALRMDPDVGEFSGGHVLGDVSEGQVQLRAPSGVAVQTTAWGLDPLEGSVHPTVIEGRWPETDREVALGTKTLIDVHGVIGQTLVVGVGDRSQSMRIVGRAVFPEFGTGPAGVGHGAGLTFHALRGLNPSIRAQDVLIRLAPGSDPRAASLRFRDYRGIPALAVPGVGLFTGLQELRQTEALPLVLGGLLALAAILTLAHMLVSSIGRRRRDLAILKTLGFVRRQVRAAVAWQATTLVAVAVVIGVPVGVATGRWGSGILADRLGVVSEPVVPLVAMAIAVPAAFLLANLIALVPGHMASRLRPATILRSE